MEIDLKLIFSLIAIIISAVTIIITKKNLKKQLRLIKLEEILEILHFLNGYYSNLFMLFNDTEKRNEILLSDEKLPEYLQELPMYRKGFIEKVDREIIINKISRLKILYNSYLPNSRNLKNKIYIISDIYYSMYQYVYTNGEIPTKQEDAIIPKRTEMERFIRNLEDSLIKEMDLGYKNIDLESRDKYFKNHFKEDLRKK